jgi:membrane-associated phospholipid phosphatase
VLLSLNLKNRWFYFFGVYLYVVILYISTNRLTFSHAHLLPLTWVDIKTPFLPWTAWIYIMVYFVPLAVGFMVNREEDLKAILFSFMGTVTICSSVFIFFPSRYPRPPLFEPTLASFALYVVRLVDTPANCLPSQHVALGFLSAFFIQRYNKVVGNWCLLLGVLIAISTLTTKQHYIWDVVTGYFLARFVFVIAQMGMKTVPAKVTLGVTAQ